MIGASFDELATSAAAGRAGWLRYGKRAISMSQTWQQHNGD